jgi:O-antigen ligase
VISSVPLANRRIHEYSLALLLIALGAGSVILFASPLPALSLLIYGACVLVVLIDGRNAYYLLPITIPWGSLIPLPATHLPISPSDAIVGALAVTWLVSRATGAKSARMNPWMAAYCALVFAMLVSIFASWSPAASLPEIAKWSEGLVVALLAPAYLTSQRDIRRVLAMVIIGACSEAGLGVCQYLLHAGPHSFDLHGNQRAFGSFGQPNPMAGYLNMVLPVSLAVAFARRSALALVGSLLIAAGTASTISRAGIVAALLAVLLVSLYYAQPLRFIAGLGTLTGISFVTLTVFGFLPIQPLTRVMTSFGLTGINFAHHTHANFSEIERAAHWVAGLRMFESFPLTGVGIGNYATAYQSFHVGNFLQPLGHAHNYFINIAAEAGILGLVTFVLFVTVGMLTALACARSATKGSLFGAVAVGTMGMWVSSTFHNLFDVLYVHELTLLVAVIMGSLLALKAIVVEPSTAGNLAR